jgi:hypothetical protein
MEFMVRWERESWSAEVGEKELWSRGTVIIVYAAN